MEKLHEAPAYTWVRLSSLFQSLFRKTKVYSLQQFVGLIHRFGLTFVNCWRQFLIEIFSLFQVFSSWPLLREGPEIYEEERGTSAEELGVN